MSKPMTEPRKLKKSESLEIRIPYPTKQAFMARCRDEGRSASEALRALIEGQLEATARRQPQPARRLGWRFIAGALIAAAVGAAAVPSLARPGLRAAEFATLDANHDGVLSFSEYSRP
jgi:hypothetical protein